MKKLSNTEITEILQNHVNAMDKTLEITIYRAYNRGQTDGLKAYFEAKLKELEESFIQRETFDEAIADIQDTFLLDECEKSLLKDWLAERLNGTQLNKNDFMRFLNDELNEQIIKIVEKNQMIDLRKFTKR